MTDDYSPLPKTWENRAERRRRAAARARQLASEYVPSKCECIHCNKYSHARRDFEQMAKNIADGNGMSGTDIWIAWRRMQK